MYINRLYLRPSILPSGLTTLQECASLDVATGWEGLDEDSLLKLDSAVKRLDLETWLQGWGLGTVLPVLVREGCNSKEALHGMDPQRALQVHCYCWPDRRLVSLCRRWYYKHMHEASPEYVQWEVTYPNFSYTSNQ